MTAADSHTLREALVAELTGSGDIRSDAVRHAFATVPRELFVPRLAAVLGLSAVYANRHLVTQERDGVPTSSSSQPSIMAVMLEALAVRPGDRILEVGLGTGYNAALLSQLTGPDGSVVSIDIDPDLVALARAALAAGGFPVSTVTGDGRRGHAGHGPYDRLIVTASGPAVPRAWWEQLRPDGILVMPLWIGSTQLIAALRRTEAGFRSSELNVGGFMSLRRPGPDGKPVVDMGVPALTLRATMPGREMTEFFASGPALGRMSSDALVDLATGLLRRRPETTTIDPVPALPVVWHTIMTGDLDAHFSVFEVSSGPRFGLVDADTGGCSLLTATRASSADEWTISTIETYGDDPTGVQRLLSSIEDWRRWGSPGFGRLAVDIAYDEADSPEWTVRRIRSDVHTISLGWR